MIKQVRELTVIINDDHCCLIRAQSDTCRSIGEVDCECFIVLKSSVINNRYSDSLYNGTRSEGEDATGGVVVNSSCIKRMVFKCKCVLLVY